MNDLKAGFASVNVTPMTGIEIRGYFVERISEGVLDDLELRALALEAGGRRAVLMSMDVCGIHNPEADSFRAAIMEATGLPEDAIFLSATHTHTGPELRAASDKPIDQEYFCFVRRRMADCARYALEDLRPARMGWAVGQAPHVAFMRRYRMKDGSIRTNPGVGNPDIEAPIGEVDERVNVLRFERPGAETLVLVNFGNHPDTIGGCRISADWPGFLRRSLEKAIDGTRCIFFNGAQGDVNHVNVNAKDGDLNDMFMDFDDVSRGYGHARHVGRVVAGAVMQPVPGRRSVGAAIRLDILQRHVPGKEDPGVLADLGDIGLGHRLALGLGVDSGEMCARVKLAHQFQCAAAVDQVIDDPQAGDVYLPMGTYTLNGSSALTYLRAQNLKLGVADQLNHQALFAALLVEKLFSSGGNFTTRLEQIDSFFQTDLSLGDIEALQSWISEIPAGGISCTVLPGYLTEVTGVVETGDALYVASADDMASIIAALESNSVPDVSSKNDIKPADPSSFTVEVQNGTEVAGAASLTGDTLKAAGFNVEKVGNAEQQIYNETLVVYRGADGPSRAQAVINALGIGRAIDGEVYYKMSTDVLVIIGGDYKPFV